MKKRILALALVASMCVSLAACGNSGSKETEGTAANSSSAAAETTADPAAATDEGTNFPVGAIVGIVAGVVVIVVVVIVVCTKKKTK